MIDSKSSPFFPILLYDCRLDTQAPERARIVVRLVVRPTQQYNIMSLIYQADTMVQGLRPALYLGGKIDAKNRERLLACHVTHILNMTPPKEASIQVSSCKL